jgi:sulfide:quinone oxidoreductase
VIIAGGGIAAAEAALALRAFAGDRAEAEILAPDAEMVLAPSAPAASFDVLDGAPTTLALREVADRAGATLRRGILSEVDPVARCATTADGEQIDFDALVVAVGAMRLAHLGEPALTFRGPADVPTFRLLLDAIERGAMRGVTTRVGIVVPPGPGWPLPAYELALQMAEHLHRSDHRHMVSISLVTAEDAPLAAFGPQAGIAVLDELSAAQIDVRPSEVVRSWTMGRLHLVSGAEVDADRVIALPVLRGPAIPGLPSDAHGFIHTDSWGRVEGLAGIYAVGDAGSFPVKQGGIACQQADTAASLVAIDLGTGIEPVPFEPVLRGVLERSEGRLFLRTDLGGGRDESSGVASQHDPLWWPPEKVAGRFLAPLLAGLAPDEELVDQAPVKEHGRRRG